MGFRRLTLTALWVFLGAAAAEPPADLSGHWRLNAELSDAPPADAPDRGRGGPLSGPRERGGNGPPPGGGRGLGHGGAPGAGPGGRPPRRGEGGPAGEIAGTPPAARALTLTVDDRWFTLTADDGRRQRFVIGGSSSTPLGGTTRTEWEGGQLVLRDEGRPPLTRRFSLTPDGGRLVLVVDGETPGGEPVHLSRIYDRVETEE